MRNTLRELFSKQGFRDMGNALHDVAINAGQGLADGATLLATAPAWLGSAAYRRFAKDPELKQIADNMYNKYINKVTGYNKLFNDYWNEQKAADGVDYSKNNTAAAVARGAATALPVAASGSAMGSRIKPLATKLAMGSPNAAAALRIASGTHPLSYALAGVQAAPNITEWAGKTIKGLDPTITSRMADDMRSRPSSRLLMNASKASAPGLLYPMLANDLGRSHAMHGLYLGGRPSVYNNSAWFEPKVGKFPGVRESMDRAWRKDPHMSMMADTILHGVRHPFKFPKGVSVQSNLPGSILQPVQYMNSAENNTLLNRAYPSFLREWDEAKNDYFNKHNYNVGDYEQTAR